MTENIDYRFRGMDAGLQSASNKAAAALGKVNAAAARASDNLEQMAIFATGLNAGVQIAGHIAESVGRIARATYDAALAYRDAAESQGRLLDPAILGGLAQVEEQIGRIKDSTGELATVLTAEAAPALGVFASIWENFTTGAGAAAGFVFENAGIGLSAVVDAADRAIDSTGRLGQGFTTGLDAVTGWTDAAVTAAEVADAVAASQDRIDESTRRATRATTEQAIAFDKSKQEEIALNAQIRQQREDAFAREQERWAIEDAQRQEALAKVKEEAMARQDAAQFALEQRRSSDSMILSSATATADALVGLTKDGSKEQAIAAKAAGLFGVVVNTAVAISQAAAQLGAFSPPAIAALAALGAAQAAVIASAPMPSFDRGGVVDGGPQFPGGTPRQRVAQVEDGEVILTRRQRQAMGGGGSTTVVLTLGARELKRVTVASGMLDGVQKRRGFGQRRFNGGG